MKKTLIILSLMLIGVIILGMPSIQDVVWKLREFTNPKLHEETLNSFKSKPNQYLLKKLNSKNYVFVGMAGGILLDRNACEAVPFLIKLLNSNNDQIKTSAFVVLGEFKDNRAIEPLLSFVNKGRNNPNFLNAIDALSIMHYEQIYPEILQMTNDNYHGSWAVDMLERYPENPQTLPALQKIADTDPEQYIREKAKEAIEKIKLSNQKK